MLPLKSFRVTGKSVSSFLSPSGRKLWQERAEKKWLVLVDEQEATESTSPIMALRDALIKVCILSWPFCVFQRSMQKSEKAW